MDNLFLVQLKIRYININHNIIILISSYPFISLINCPWLLFHGIILLSFYCIFFAGIIPSDKMIIAIFCMVWKYQNILHFNSINNFIHYRHLDHYLLLVVNWEMCLKFNDFFSKHDSLSVEFGMWKSNAAFSINSFYEPFLKVEARYRYASRWLAGAPRNQAINWQESSSRSTVSLELLAPTKRRLLPAAVLPALQNCIFLEAGEKVPTIVSLLSAQYKTGTVSTGWLTLVAGLRPGHLLTDRFFPAVPPLMQLQ